MFNDNAFIQVRNGLKDLWEKDQLTNALIKTDDGQQFRVHWELLVALSPTVDRMVEALPTTPADSTSFLQLTIPNISGITMSSIINWAYRGTLRVHPRKVESLIRAANLLEIPAITNLCIKFLSDEINEDTCIAVYKFAKHFQCTKLFRKARTFLLVNFEKIYPTSLEFLELQKDDVDGILRSDNLNLTDEEHCFLAIMLWVEHDLQERRVHLPVLLALVRFGFCSQTFYNDIVATNPLLIENAECHIMMYQWNLILMDINLNSNHLRPIDLHHQLLRPRIPNELIFAIGGWSNGSATNVIETYDIRAGRWFLCAHTDNMPRAYHGLISLDRMIYMIGGFDGNQCFNTVRCYDPLRHMWSEKACMYVARCYISVTSVDGNIYALGGYDGHGRVNSAERYDLGTNQWNMIANMNQVRSDASATTLENKIYIAGGFNGQQVLNSAEMYDPETDTWTVIPDMSSPRSGVNLISYKDMIFVIGGFNGTNRLNTVERFDTKQRQWLPVPPMNIPRSNFATASFEGKLFAIGGFNGLTTVPSVEYYSDTTNTWVIVTEMNINRSALAACVMKDLLNGYEYSFIGNSPS